MKHITISLIILVLFFSFIGTAQASVGGPDDIPVVKCGTPIPPDTVIPPNTQYPPIDSCIGPTQHKPVPNVTFPSGFTNMKQQILGSQAASVQRSTPQLFKFAADHRNYTSSNIASQLVLQDAWGWRFNNVANKSGFQGFSGVQMTSYQTYTAYYPSYSGEYIVAAPLVYPQNNGCLSFEIDHWWNVGGVPGQTRNYLDVNDCATTYPWDLNTQAFWTDYMRPSAPDTENKFYFTIEQSTQTQIPCFRFVVYNYTLGRWDLFRSVCGNGFGNQGTAQSFIYVNGTRPCITGTSPGLWIDISSFAIRRSTLSYTPATAADFQPPFRVGPCTTYVSTNTTPTYLKWLFI